MQIERAELVKLLHTEGDNERADKVAAELPEQIDTDRDGDALAAVGLDRTQLMAKLADARGSTGLPQPLKGRSRASSSLATPRMCTASGPSTMRRVRALA
jgi:hypothetical protein